MGKIELKVLDVAPVEDGFRTYAFKSPLTSSSTQRLPSGRKGKKGGGTSGSVQVCIGKLLSFTTNLGQKWI